MVTILFLAKAIAGSGLLYIYYYLFLCNKRFHRYNRFYLLAIPLVSVIIPLLHIPVQLFGGSQQHGTLVKTLRVMNADGWESPVTVYAASGGWRSWLTRSSVFYALYFAGVAIGTSLLLKALDWIRQIKQKYPYSNIDAISIYQVSEPGTPFSFFKSIFWDSQTSLHASHGQHMFRHEMFHVKEKHSADILLLEVFCCVGWFNPFYHLIKRS